MCGTLITKILQVHLACLSDAHTVIPSEARESLFDFGPRKEGALASLGMTAGWLEKPVTHI